MARAFRAHGWEAWECDTEPTRDVENERWHIRDDVLTVARRVKFDLFILPPALHIPECFRIALEQAQTRPRSQNGKGRGVFHALRARADRPHRLGESDWMHEHAVAQAGPDRAAIRIR
jgi:hypothetical protein